MAMPDNTTVEFPQTVAGTVDVDTVPIDIRQLTEKGYDYNKGVGAAFTAVLEGSVSGSNWTSILSLAASGQGAIAAHYNLARLRVTVGGALGTGTRLVVSGKVL